MILSENCISVCAHTMEVVFDHIDFRGMSKTSYQNILKICSTEESHRFGMTQINDDRIVLFFG